MNAEPRREDDPVDLLDASATLGRLGRVVHVDDPQRELPAFVRLEETSELGERHFPAVDDHSVMTDGADRRLMPEATMSLFGRQVSRRQPFSDSLPQTPQRQVRARL